MNHYVYEITYENGKKYIGSRSCKVSPIEDTSYLGSSKYTPTGLKCVKEILKTTATRKEALSYEEELHKTLKVSKNPLYYNQANQSSTKFSTQGLTADTCNWVAEKAKKRVLSHEVFVAKVLKKHKVVIEYTTKYVGAKHPISFKCPRCSNETTVNTASNHAFRQILCKNCAKIESDLKQKAKTGKNRSQKQKLADKQRKLYKGDNRTSSQKVGSQKAAKTAQGKKCRARGKPGTASTLFKPWYYITPDGIRYEKTDITISDFLKTEEGKHIRRGAIFHATSKYPGKKLERGSLKGYTFGFL